MSGFRIIDPCDMNHYIAGIVLNSGRLHFVSSYSAKIIDKPGQKQDLKGEVKFVI